MEQVPTKTESSSQVKFTQEEVTEITSIRDSYEMAIGAMGRLEWQRREIKKAEAKLEADVAQLEAREKAFLDAIVAKYGEGSFDIATGVFTPKSA